MNEHEQKAADNESLFEEFPGVSTKEWEEKIRTDLKGADYRKRLAWKTLDGFTVMPFYREEDLRELSHLNTTPGYYPFIRGTRRAGNAWNIRQDIYDKQLDEANAIAREAVEKGADALGFRMEVKHTAGALGGDIYGVNVQQQSDLKQLLEGIDPEQVELHFDAGMASPAYLAMLSNVLKQQGADSSKVRGTFMYDPATFLAVNGQLHKKNKAWVKDAAHMVSHCKEKLPGVRCLGVNTKPYHNAGASTVQQVAFALAAGSDYLAKLTEAGIPAGDIAERIHFSFAVGSSYFPEIAKFRAARMLWAKIVKQYGVTDESRAAMYLQGQTSMWNKTVYDAHNNMLRGTTEAMSAAIGGCDSITVDPFDLAFRQPDAFSRRIARNTQIILKEEANLDKVADPAAGSYYLEQLTESIAQTAWELFQELEANGGFYESILDGLVQSQIEETRVKIDQAIASGKKVFVGTNRYPAPDAAGALLGEPYSTASLSESDDDHEIDNDKLFESLSSAFSKGAQLGDIISDLFLLSKHDLRPIRPYRGARAFEDLRLAVERYAEKQGQKPTVYLMPLGNRKMRKARATFSANFFGCGGYDVVEPLGFDTVDEAVEAAKDKEPDIVVICSSDPEYPELVKPICDKVKKFRKRPWVVLAGYPEEHLKEFKKAGVDTFIHRKANVLEILSEYHRNIGIEI